MALFAVTTQSSKESEAADAIVTQSGSDVYAAVAPQSLTGYIFVEAAARSAVENVVNRIGYVNKVVPGEVSMTEIEEFLTPSSDTADIVPGERVHITGGAYEGSDATVTNVNSNDETVTVELINEPIKIPIELPGSQVRPA